MRTNRVNIILLHKTRDFIKWKLSSKQPKAAENDTIQPAEEENNKPTPTTAEKIRYFEEKHLKTGLQWSEGVKVHYFY